MKVPGKKQSTNTPKSALKSVNKSAHKSAAQQVRIIGGLYKRTPLPVLDAEGLRPTPDRVRETVFNWLHHLVDGAWGQMHCLDVFAGSGALGFEAASRGACHVQMNELNRQAWQQLKQTQEKLKAEQVHITCMDAITRLEQAQTRGEQFDLIFLDPPFHRDFLEKCLPLCAKLLRVNGFLYVEAEQNFVWGSDWETLREDKAGQVVFKLLRCSNLSATQTQ
jgi:16S rRNA (guanine(966)-N(2))-methyltransferase RsmD